MKLFNKNKQDENKKEKKEITKDVVENEVEEVAATASPVLPKGGDADSYKIILSPHITERATLMNGQNKHVFRVLRTAGKIEIKVAIENLYKVKVDRVNLSYAKSKLRMVGRKRGIKPGFKKAIVSLRDGSKIDVTN
ncbi:MAG: 50S ribosomal protein L23 [Patescibacteria group bacterium]